nr:hypothetical protein [uncultured Flavobacterium sp.]
MSFLHLTVQKKDSPQKTPAPSSFVQSYSEFKNTSVQKAKASVKGKNEPANTIAK